MSDPVQTLRDYVDGAEAFAALEQVARVIEAAKETVLRSSWTTGHISMNALRSALEPFGTTDSPAPAPTYEGRTTR
jgi:hypothetical protein